MFSLTVNKRTYDRVTDLAHAWSITEDATITRLIDFWKDRSGSSASREDEVSVHALYGGQRAEGTYHPGTGRIDIISGPGAGMTGLKPSPAAIEVVKAVNPKVSPNRNGWSFWIVDATGEWLQSLRGTPRS